MLRSRRDRDADPPLSPPPIAAPPPPGTVPAPPPRRRWARQRGLREALFLLIGVITPVGVLAVNGSAYIIQHLPQFRVGLAVSAFISNLFLQGLAVYAALRQAGTRFPALYTEYRRIVTVLAVIGVLAWSSFGAWGTYVSMQSARRLPNAPAVLISLWLLLLPVVTVFIGRRLRKRRGPSRGSGL